MGNPNDDMRMGLGVDLDDGSFRQADKAYDTIEKDILAVGKATKIASRDLKSLGSITEKSAKQSLDDLQAMRKELIGIGDAAEKATKSTKGIGVGGGGIAGKTISVGKGISGAISPAFEATRGIEELTKAVPNLASSLASGVATMGPLGIAASVALVAVTAAIAIFNESTREQAEEIKRRGEEERRIAIEIADGLTTAQAEIEEQSAQKRKAQLEKTLAEDVEAYEEWANDRSELQKRLEQVFGNEEDVLDQNIKTTEAQIKAFQSTTDEYREALESGDLAANDAADAQKEAAKSAEKAAAKQKKEAEKAATTQTREAEKAATSQIKAAEDSARKAQETANKIIAANQKYAQAVDDINKDLNRSIRDALKDSQRAMRDLTVDANRSQLEAGRTANDASLELNKGFHREAERAQRDNQRALKDIIKQGTRSQQDLLAARDFLALDQLSKQTQRQLEDVGSAANVEADEREIATKEARDDLKEANRIDLRERQIAFRDQRNDLKQSLREQRLDLRQASNDRLADAATALNRELETAQQGANALLNMEVQFWQSRIGIAQSAMGVAPAGGGGNVNLTINGANMSTMQMQNVALDVMARVGLT